jgi:spermidine synthase
VRGGLVYGLSLVLAFCSFYYELALGQILSVNLGGTKQQYFIIFALFTTALGFGSLCFGRLKKNYPLEKIFVGVEIALTLLGGLSPFVITGLFASLSTFWAAAISYFLVFSIGFASGFELICLFTLLPQNHGKILTFDYLGMLAAALLFPYYLLPELGVGASTVLVATLNLAALTVIMPLGPKMRLALSAVVGISVLLSYQQQDTLQDFLVKLYLGAK